jgi:hypothetical protein
VIWNKPQFLWQPASCPGAIPLLANSEKTEKLLVPKVAAGERERRSKSRFGNFDFEPRKTQKNHQRSA